MVTKKLFIYINTKNTDYGGHAKVCGGLVAVIAGSNPAEVMDVFHLC
jgi:hypothetical protein